MGNALTTGRLLILLLGIAISGAASADMLTIAVASNFRVPAEEIAAQFRRETGAEVRISSASTGKLYAQIANGAPFDVFLAADAQHPGLIAESFPAVAETRRTYALGALVLWSRDASLAEGGCREALAAIGNRRLAIANPEIAPYGAAARQFLVGAGLWEGLQGRIVYGENIAQALHFVASGNAQLGLVARAQALDPRLPAATCSWPVPETLHEPILQQAILLPHGLDKPAAAAFVEFLGSAPVRDIIAGFGYGIPE